MKKSRVILRVDDETAAFLSTIKNKSAFVREAIRAKAEAEAKTPKKFPLSEIIKDPNKVIHCPREDEAKTLFAELEKRGLQWGGDVGCISNTYYESYHEETCYYPNCRQYCEKSFYENNGNEVIEFSDVDLTK